MTFLSLDINSARMYAMAGPVDGLPSTVALEPPRAEMPMVVMQNSYHGSVGSEALVLARQQPDQIYRNFLPKLIFTEKKNGWFGRFRRGTDLDSRNALEQILRKVKQITGPVDGVLLSLPPYLAADQVEIVSKTARDLRLPVIGSTVSPVAQALAAYADHPWYGSAIVFDLDDHALWMSILQESDGHAHLIESYAFEHLGINNWKHRILNALADCCILQSRRDPRESPDAENMLFMQIDSIMECCHARRPVNVAFQTANWFQHLMLQPDDTEAFCAALVQQIVAEIAGVFNASVGRHPSAVILSHEASLLPGLATSIGQYLETWSILHRDSHQEEETDDEDDFGAGLLRTEDFVSHQDATRLVVLPADATARAVHALGERFREREFRHRHLNATAPLPEPEPLDHGPARIHFQGQDYFLNSSTFTIGQRYDCDLSLDREHFPSISPWHCEIVFDSQQCHQIRDLSREGTWLNDLPVTELTRLTAGDRIRLGPNGPTLRFLGHPQVSTSVITIARI